ncbi:hypothetical protein [Humibacillus sp. DSM 29435]|nr:hypothetical protein [Humibacillus sp. DSM 29435]
MNSNPHPLTIRTSLRRGLGLTATHPVSLPPAGSLAVRYSCDQGELRQL